MRLFNGGRLCSDSLTGWSRIIAHTLIVSQLFKKLFLFYKNITTVFTGVRQQDESSLQ